MAWWTLLASPITGLINGEDFRAPLDGDVHDRVSLQYGLMYDLLNGGAREHYFLQDAEELKPLTLTNVGTIPNLPPLIPNT